jgi:hypothetical protein
MRAWLAPRATRGYVRDMLARQDVQRSAVETVAAHMPPGQPWRVIVEPYVNWVDVAGLRITVVTDEMLKSPITDEARFGLDLALHDQLEAAGETRFPRLSFRTEGELAHIDDPDA